MSRGSSVEIFVKVGNQQDGPQKGEVVETIFNLDLAIAVAVGVFLTPFLILGIFYTTKVYGRRRKIKE